MQRNFKLCYFPFHSVCFLQNFFFRSEQKFLPVLYPCAKFYKFSPSTFRDIFDRNINFANFTRSLDLHLREPGVLARARAISGSGRARQETTSSHLKQTCRLYIYIYIYIYIYTIYLLNVVLSKCRVTFVCSILYNLSHWL